MDPNRRKELIAAVAKVGVPEAVRRIKSIAQEMTLDEALEWAISRLTDFPLDEPEDLPRVAACLRALAKARGEDV